MDFNGTVRPYVESLGSREYIGVDMARGPGVDEVCDVHDLLKRFGEASFDVVISTEMLEHVEDWREVIRILKAVVRVGGVLLVTTRSPGFPYHGYPFDFWRYEVEDMHKIFALASDLVVESDPVSPGVFVCARRPVARWETGYDDLLLHSIVTGKRTNGHTQLVLRAFRIYKRAELAARAVIPASAKRRVRRVLARVPR
jgi:SAM-dependent methyltransferase